MRSKTLGLFAVTLLISVALAFAGETPAPAPEAAPRAAAQEPAALEGASVELPQVVQLPAEETCSASASSAPEAGESCGGTICGTFEYCCNPSCGTCVFYGMSCTQQSCN